MSSQQYVYLLRFLFFSGLVWVVFFNLSANPSPDAVTYAQGVVHGIDFIYPHHLLHGIVGRYVWLPVLGYLTQAPNPLSGAQAYTWLALSNGIGYLVLVFGLNQYLAHKGQALHPATLLIASSWGLLRFSVEFEAYIWPCVFVLGGIILIDQRRFSRGGLCLATAFLFHQISVLWLLPALWVVWKVERWKAVAKLLFPWLILIPLYSWAWIDTTPHLPFLDYLLGEFSTGGVKTDWTVQHLALWVVSIIRTWVQVHGYQFILITQKPTYALALGSAGLLITAIYMVIGWVGSGKKSLFSADYPALFSPKVAKYSILMLMLGGLWAQGNAEFLVGLTLAVALAFSAWLDSRRALTVSLSGVFMGINIAFGLVPQNLLVLSPYEAEANALTTSGTSLATYHKLEVDTWAGPNAQRTSYHAQALTSKQGKFYYNGSPLSDTVLLLEQMPAPALSRASILENHNGTPPGAQGKVVATLQHLGGPTKLVELRPNR